MTLRVKRMVRVARGARPDPHRGSRGDSGVIDLDGPTFFRLVRIDDLGMSRTSARRDSRRAVNDSPLRTARGM
jgi:hypothetical protein